MADRVDYIIGYPEEAQYIARDLRRSDDILYFPLSEMTNSHVLVYAGCPKNAWGKEVIGSVNSALEEIRETPEFIGFYENMLDPKSQQFYHENIIQKLK